MLIIEIKEEETENQKGFWFKRNKRKPKSTIERQSLKLGREIHTILKMPVCECENPEFKRLKNFYKGKILVPVNTEIQTALDGFLFDPKQYYKRALLSSLNKILSENANKYGTVCISDSEFLITREYTNTAKIVKNLVLITQKNINTQKFADYCYFNLGSVPQIKECAVFYDWDIFLNFDRIFDDATVQIHFKDGKKILHPDSDYFVCDESFYNIISCGILVKTVCAAFEVKKNEDVNWEFRI